MQILPGYKSYISAVLLFVVGGLLFMGVIDTKQAEAVAIMLGGAYGAALRGAVGKIEQ